MQNRHRIYLYDKNIVLRKYSTDSRSNNSSNRSENKNNNNQLTFYTPRGPDRNNNNENIYFNSYNLNTKFNNNNSNTFTLTKEHRPTVHFSQSNIYNRLFSLFDLRIHTLVFILTNVRSK